MQRRPFAPFSLSFLDIMFCGFGAVVLLVLLLDSDTVRTREATFADRRAEIIRLEQEVLRRGRQLAQIRSRLAASERALQATAAETASVQRELRQIERDLEGLSDDNRARREHISQLEADLKDLEQERVRLDAQAAVDRARGERVREFVGEADRQYLTGLRLGGKHILILVDASASMLDETLINIVRRRNMAEPQRRDAPKWRRALLIADWLVSNLPPSARFILYTFDTRPTAAPSSQDGKWMPAARRDDVATAMRALYRTVPGGGTSLYHAFAVADRLVPKPDNILLITDGLPTQGQKRPERTTVSAAQRLRHLGEATQVLPARIPVNTILLPLEGDAHAAAAYWRLALDTRGSFLTPARDWP